MKATLSIENKIARFDLSKSSEMTREQLIDELHKCEVTRCVYRARVYELDETGDFSDALGNKLKFGFLF